MTDIQYFAANYVAFKENLTEQDKGFLIKWIKENSDDKIKSLLMTGDYKYQQEAVGQFDKTFPILNEGPSWVPGVHHYTKSGIIPDRYLSSVDMNKLAAYIDKRASMGFEHGKDIGKSLGTQAGISKGAAMGIGGAVAAALIITVAYKMYKRFLSKAARACKHKSGDEKTSCMNKYKKEALKQRIKALNQGMASCSKTKNTGKCKQKITGKIRKLQAQLGEL
jgi:hypothetical protein